MLVEDMTIRDNDGTSFFREGKYVTWMKFSVVNPELCKFHIYWSLTCCEELFC